VSAAAVSSRGLAVRQSFQNPPAVDEVLIYREEVTGIMYALGDMVTYLREIKELLGGEEEADE
jgi:hypothetical protein